MDIKKTYNVYELMNECWGGAEDTLQTIINNGLEDEFIDLFENTWLDEIPDLVQVNDWLRFDWEDIYISLGIQNE